MVFIDWARQGKFQGKYGVDNDKKSWLCCSDVQFLIWFKETEVVFYILKYHTCIPFF